MKMESWFLRLLMASRPLLIVTLSFVSGWTTWNGLRLFIQPEFAGVLTVAIQSLIVIATYQLSKIYWRAAPVRYLSVFAGLFSALSVSVFFSYFAFFSRSDGERVALGRLDNVQAQLEAYVGRVFDARQAALLDLGTRRDALRAAANRALVGEGRVRPGVGPIYGELMRQATEVDTELRRATDSRDLELAARFISRWKGDSTKALSDPRKYAQMISEFITFKTVADSWLLSNHASVIAAPLVPPFESITTIRPSMRDLKAFSSLSFAFAFIFDFLTILLTFWLEAIPYGELGHSDSSEAADALLTFREWNINRANHLEFGLARSESEYNQNYNDGRRRFWTAHLLNLGLCRRVDKDHVEFTPRLYPLFSKFLSQETHGGD